MSQPFIIERRIHAPASRVWKAITDKNEMKNWYFDLDEFRPEVGFEFSFPGKGSKGATYIHLCKIIEVIPEQKLSYSWTYRDQEGYSVVTFELKEEDGITLLRLKHEGLESFPANNPDFAGSSFEAGWTELIGKSIIHYLEQHN